MIMSDIKEKYQLVDIYEACEIIRKKSGKDLTIGGFRNYLRADKIKGTRIKGGWILLKKDVENFSREKPGRGSKNYISHKKECSND